MSKRKLVILISAILSSVVTNQTIAGDGTPEFVLINRTGFPIWYLFVKQPGVDYWSGDILNGVLGNDASTKVKLNSKACKWDIQIQYFGGDSATWKNVDTCAMNVMTVTWNSADNKYSAKGQ